MAGLLTKARTARAIGPKALLGALGYRVRLRAGLHPVQRLKDRTPPAGEFFARPRETSQPAQLVAPPDWDSDAHLFGAHPIILRDAAPDWTVNPLSGQPHGAAALLPWWEIADTAGIDSEIKPVWELSRMAWALRFAQRARLGDEASRQRLNAWLESWAQANPPYRGPNWRCGQEAGLHVLHLFVAASILGQERQTAAPLLELIGHHLDRITPTIGYASAQDNNHLISEAAALFVGGAWLEANHLRGKGFARKGREMLERGVGRLIDDEGGFSLYSVNYHRSVLDTLSIAEYARRKLCAAPFSADFIRRAAAATDWLAAFVDPETGDAPNMGANDGSRLLPLTATPFRDFRPSIQLAATLFQGRRVYQPGPHDDGVRWLGLDAAPLAPNPLESTLYDSSGFAILRRDRVAAFVRYPRFRFRPSQSDALHLDLWINGVPVLRDGGTYSYNAPVEVSGYFSSAAAHNTVQMDGDDQMPRLGRFLLGDWIKTADRALQIEGNAAILAAAYHDYRRRRHARRVALTDRNMEVQDDVSGFDNSAILRWRLMPGPWTVGSNSISLDGFNLSVTSSVPVRRFELVTGQESLHYLEQSDIPVLEVEISRPGLLTTCVEWTS